MTKQLISTPVGEVKMIKGYGSTKSRPQVQCTYSLSVDVSLDCVQEQITEFRRKFGKDYTDLNFQESSDCGCRHDCHCSPEYVLCGKRLETDLEYNFRLADEAEKARAQKERDERELDALAKKLGKQIV